MRPGVHYCKHCDSYFSVRLHSEESADLFLECPTCLWHHYRHFEDGVAVHCEISRTAGPPLLVKGHREPPPIFSQSRVVTGKSTSRIQLEGAK